MVAVPDAIRTVLQETAHVCLTSSGRPVEVVKLKDSSNSELLGRTLAAAVTMRAPGYPPYQASIMDGFAVQTADCKQGPVSININNWTHAVADKIFAGDEKQPKSGGTSNGLATAYYVTTGAVVPTDFDCVVPIEQCRVDTETSRLAIDAAATIQPGKWIRSVGCDIPASSVVLPAGHVLDPVAIGLLHQAGQATIELCSPVRVGVLSTGTELITGNGTDWDIMRSGTIPDVNRPVLLSLLSTFGTCVPVDLGMARDDNIDAMTGTIESALHDCDIIITTGGISMGETDAVEHVLVERLRGRLHFGRMHMKPGKPTTFVTIPSQHGTRLVFAMPGNPVSATVCTQLLVRPCLDLLFSGPDKSADTHGDSVEEQIRRIVLNARVHPEVQVKLAHDFKLDSERPEYHRVVLQSSIDGSYQASSTGVQRSSRLMSLRDAQGLLVLPRASSSKPAALTGETYLVLLLQNQGRQTQLCDSLHLTNKNSSTSLKIGIVQIIAPDGSESETADISERVVKALSGSKSGSATISSLRTYSGPAETFVHDVGQASGTDILVISCCKFSGSFRYFTELSSKLRTKLEKVADAMALQARRGAASQDPTAALFEVVVGFRKEGRGAMVILLPEQGLDGGLGNVRGLLKHALHIARGPNASN